jgi:lysine 2,3-aminomutase
MNEQGSLATPRPAVWRDVPDEKWNDWRWQLSHRLSSLEELQEIVNLTPEEVQGISAKGRFRLDIPPYFASLIDPDDPDCPIRRQVIPIGREFEAFDSLKKDSLDEDHHSPVRGLVHRYPDRVLMLVTTECASYCRHCTRSRLVGDDLAAYSSRDYDAQIDYIARTPQVRDVLLSGGDPLVMNQKVLEDLLARLRAIPHVEILRIGSRAPCYLPQRVDEKLVSMLHRFHPLWMNIHFNHPKEITPEARRACEMLADAGIPLGCQTVLLAGINDCPNTMKKLCHELVKMRVRPYYIYQCDLVPGTRHFHTPVAKGLEIMEALRGHTSGLAVPTYVIDAPGGGGKTPVAPNYLLSMNESKVVLRNFEGYIATYSQPTGYKSHDPSTCEYCQNAWPEPGQRGVAGLLAGEQAAIKPEGFEDAHQRMAANLEMDAEPLPAQVH